MPLIAVSSVLPLVPIAISLVDQWSALLAHQGIIFSADSVSLPAPLVTTPAEQAAISVLVTVLPAPQTPAVPLVKTSTSALLAPPLIAPKLSISAAMALVQIAVPAAPLAMAAIPMSAPPVQLTATTSAETASPPAHRDILLS